MAAGAGGAPEPAAFGDPRSWTRLDGALLGLVLAAGLAIRAWLLPAEGHPGDLDQFVAWIRHLATTPLGGAYDEPIAFPPVMVFIWELVAWLEPAFRTAASSADPALRVALKLPTVVAEVGLALGVAWGLRSRPGWAVAAAAGIFLHPAVLDVGAWWGQYEAIFVLPALLAILAAAAGRRDLAAVLLAVSLMAKPQAAPFLVPFAAWYLATGGWRGAARAAAIGLATITLLWLPFLGSGGLANYLEAILAYQNETFPFLSLRAWNAWWLVQEVAAGGGFVTDKEAVLGPLTARHLGLAVTALLELVVFAAVLRRPSPAVLAIGLAAAALVAFGALTTMHERYAYAAIVFLPLAFPDRRVVALWLALSVTFALNLVWAVPPPGLEAVADAAWLGWLGPLAMIGITVGVLWLLVTVSREGGQERGRAEGDGEPGWDVRRAGEGATADPGTAPEAQRGTSAGSVATTAGA